MKLTLCILAALAVVSLQAEVAPGTKKAAPKKTTAPTIEPLKLPPGAVQVDAVTYTYTDAKGKKWIYRQTPFGLSRAEDKPVEPNVAPVNIPATDSGDSVKFERPGPFGVYRWEKKKTELTDDERAAWERSRGADHAPAKAKE